MWGTIGNTVLLVFPWLGTQVYCCTYRGLVLVTAAFFTTQWIIFHGAFTRDILHGIEGVVFVKLFIVAPGKDVAFLFLYVIGPMRANRHLFAHSSLLAYGDGKEGTGIAVLVALRFGTIRDTRFVVGADFGMTTVQA